MPGDEPQAAAVGVERERAAADPARLVGGREERRGRARSCPARRSTGPAGRPRRARAGTRRAGGRTVRDHVAARVGRDRACSAGRLPRVVSRARHVDRHPRALARRDRRVTSACALAERVAQAVGLDVRAWRRARARGRARIGFAGRGCMNSRTAASICSGVAVTYEPSAGWVADCGAIAPGATNVAGKWICAHRLAARADGELAPAAGCRACSAGRRRSRSRCAKIRTSGRRLRSSPCSRSWSLAARRKSCWRAARTMSLSRWRKRTYCERVGAAQLLVAGADVDLRPVLGDRQAGVRVVVAAVDVDVDAADAG